MPYTENDYLLDEIRRYREAESQRIDDAIARERRERAERHRRDRERQRQAEYWQDALHKQALLFDQEARWLDEPQPDDWFGPGASACRRALEIWKEEAPAIEERIADLEAAIQALREELRRRAGRRLKDESDGSRGWVEVADMLIAPDCTPTDWLHW